MQRGFMKRAEDGRRSRQKVGRAMGAALCLWLWLLGAAWAEAWTFAVVADNRSAFASFTHVLNEIRDLKANPERAFTPVEAVLVCGDLSPAADNLILYRSVFGHAPPLLVPVRGNHEKAADLETIRKEMLLPLGGRAQALAGKGITYFTDWKNVRWIVLDQYAAAFKDLDDAALLRWVEESIRSAGHARHVFVAFHEPLFPDQPWDAPLWSLLLRRRDKVKAVFVGHTHQYLHRRFPDTIDGIHVVNVGNAGWVSHSDGRQTVVEVSVEDDRLTFRTVQAPDKSGDFKLREQWEVR